MSWGALAKNVKVNVPSDLGEAEASADDQIKDITRELVAYAAATPPVEDRDGIPYPEWLAKHIHDKVRTIVRLNRMSYDCMLIRDERETHPDATTVTVYCSRVCIRELECNAADQARLIDTDENKLIAMAAATPTATVPDDEGNDMEYADWVTWTVRQLVNEILEEDIDGYRCELAIKRKSECPDDVEDS